MHDPYQPWDGDQINFSLRAWTRGYRMFAPKRPVIWQRKKWNNLELISNYDWRTTILDIQQKTNKFNNFLWIFKALTRQCI